MMNYKKRLSMYNSNVLATHLWDGIQNLYLAGIVVFLFFTISVRALDFELEERLFNKYALSVDQLNKLEITAPVVDELERGEGREFIVVFDDAQVKKETNQLNPQSNARIDQDVLREFRIAALQMLKTSVLARLQKVDLHSVRDYSQLPLVTLRLVGMEQVQELLEIPEIVGVFEDQLREMSLAQSLPLINQPPVAASGHTGAGTTVAVLDTGVDYTKMAFGSCTMPGSAGCKVVFAQDFASDDGSLDDNGHGTNVAGTVLGVAPDAGIAALDVFKWVGLNFGAYDSDIIDALNWTIANQSTYNIVAANLSLGKGRYFSLCSSSVYTTVFANLRSSGILPVVASGNNGYKDSMNEPACAPGAVSVGAVYDANVGGLSWGNPLTCTDPTTMPDQVTCFSNSSDFLTILAPGALINAAGITMGGTSQAAPHVAGAAAVLQAAHPSDSIAKTETRMIKGGVPVTDAANGITKPRLNLDGSMNLSICALYPALCFSPCKYKWWPCYEIKIDLFDDICLTCPPFEFEFGEDVFDPPPFEGIDKVIIGPTPEIVAPAIPEIGKPGLDRIETQTFEPQEFIR